MKPSFRTCLLILFLSPLIGLGQTPELSADKPIAYSEDTGLLIATGNAVFVDENTRVEADEIRYNREEDRIEASGNVKVTRQGLRLLAEYLTYDAQDKTFSATNFRAGYPPLFIEGDYFSGSLDAVDFSRVTLYYREPVASAPKLSMRNGSWVADEFVKGRGLSLKTFGNFGIPLPGITYAFGQTSVEVEASIGHIGNLGAYAQSYWLYPYTEKLSIGGNFDLYTLRGVLVGPALRWGKERDPVQAYLNTGWIHDHAFEERGFDILGERIDQERGFVDFGFSARDEGRVQFQTKGTYLSDSEVLRDFREDIYLESLHPDHYADFTFQERNFLLNVFARAQINDSYTMVERLPEIVAEWLPREVADTGFFLQASAAATRYRVQEVVPGLQSIFFPDNPLGLPSEMTGTGSLPADLEHSAIYNRLESAVTLTRPFHGPHGTQLVLRGGGRWSYYRQDETDWMPSGENERLVGELGFDLSQTLVRTYRVDNPRWRFDKLHHQVRSLVQYRWHPVDGDVSEVVPPFDLYPYRARQPVLDLADLRHADVLQDWNVARIGMEHRILVADGDDPYREFLGFDLYQDVNLDRDPGEDTWDALYAGMDFTPFAWLRLQWAQKIRTEDFHNEASLVRATVRSADLWTLSLQAEYLEKAIHQYRVDADYRVSENFGVFGTWYYDVRLSAFTRQRYGITRRFGNVWQMELYLTLRDQNVREDDFSVGLRLRWLSF